MSYSLSPIGLMQWSWYSIFIAWCVWIPVPILWAVTLSRCYFVILSGICVCWTHSFQTWPDALHISKCRTLCPECAKFSAICKPVPMPLTKSNLSPNLRFHPPTKKVYGSLHKLTQIKAVCPVDSTRKQPSPAQTHFTQVQTIRNTCCSIFRDCFQGCHVVPCGAPQTKDRAVKAPLKHNV